MAGRLRAVHSVGLGGPIFRWPAAARGGRRPSRARRGAVRTDETPPAQRQPSGDVLFRLPCRLPARARGRESSDRIPKWLLPVVRENLAAGRDVRLAAAVVASWARYAEGVDEQGQSIQVVDRLADSL